jgi:hypothetical protein
MKQLKSLRQERRALATLAVAAFMATSSPAPAQTVAFTEAGINSLSSVLDPALDDARSNTGADVVVGPIAGSRPAFFGTSTPLVGVVKMVTDDVYAKASLASAALKTKGVLQLGSNTSVFGAGLAVGSRNGSGHGSASFGDSFRTFSGPKPYLWTNGSIARFQFSVTGQVTVTGTVPNPADTAPPKPRNLVYAFLSINIYKPGTIDLLRQLRESYSTALANQIQANLITRDYWYFGQLIADFTEPAAKILPIAPGTPTNVEFTFTPGGDFDWVALLETMVQLDAAHQNVGATLDFSNSIDSSYQGPPGTTTYSGSSVFPSTSPFSQIPPPNVCPAGLGYWKNRASLWPVSSLVLGNETYTQAELLSLLGASSGGDASAILTMQLIAAKLNIANYSNPAPISATVTAADNLLKSYSGKLPYNVKPNTAAGAAMVQAADTLESYNQKLLTPTCAP